MKSASANEVGQVTVEGNLNVRTSPSTQGEILGKLQNGDEVQIISRTADWLEISSKIGDGFVHSSYIQVHTANKPTNITDKSDASNQSNASAATKQTEATKDAKGSGTANASNTPIATNTSNKTSASTASSSLKDISVYVNGQLLKLPIAPPVIDGRVLVPFRGIGENLGIDVKWLNDTRQVVATDSSTKVVLTIDNKKVTVNNNTLTLDAAPTIVQTSTVIPLRFFAESYGADVQWLEKERKVIIERKTVSSGREESTSGNVQPPVIEDEVGTTDKDTIKGKVTATSLNVRESADANSLILGALAKGQEILIYDIEGTWAHIKYNGMWGYVHTGYVSMQVNQQAYTTLSSPALETYDGTRAWLTWIKVGSVTTSHKLISGGVEISTNASHVDEWDASHPAINRIEYSGSAIRIYFNPGYNFVVRHTAKDVRVTLLSSGLQGKRIVVDAGHGNQDPGAKGPGGTKEKDVNLAVALKVADVLRSAGAEVTLTRSNDTFVELAGRVKIAKDHDADAFVSIHSDAFKATSSGTTTYYHSGKNPSWQQSKQLSDIAIKKLTAELGTVSRGSNNKSLHVIRETDMPAILAEMAFISNPKEEALLKSNDFQQKVAQAVLDSFEEFYN